MDYKEYTRKRRGDKLVILVLILACAVAVQCVTIAALWSLNARYKSLYNEALESRIEMQEEINSLNESNAAADIEQNYGAAQEDGDN